MNIRPRNWLFETRNQELERRIKALEAATEDFRQLYNNYYNHVHEGNRQGPVDMPEREET